MLRKRRDAHKIVTSQNSRAETIGRVPDAGETLNRKAAAKAPATDVDRCSRARLHGLCVQRKSPPAITITRQTLRFEHWGECQVSYESFTFTTYTHHRTSHDCVVGSFAPCVCPRASSSALLLTAIRLETSCASHLHASSQALTARDASFFSELLLSTTTSRPESRSSHCIYKAKFG